MKNNLVFDAFNTLYVVERTSSTNEKRDTLMRHINNNILRDLFYWTYNPFYRYYSNKIEYIESDNKNTSLYPQHIVEFKRILSRLNARYITGNSARDMITKFLNKCDKHEQYWYSKVITRDLRCGVNVTTINKLYGPDFIKEFPVALADYDDMSKPVYPEYFALQDKYDGYRCLSDVDEYISMLTRNGNDLNGYDEIQYILNNCFANKFIYDGELISSTFKGTQNSAFKKGNGKKANYHIFDIIPKDDFYDATGGMPLKDRQMQLKEVFDFAQRQSVKKRIDISCMIEVKNLMVGDGNIKEHIKKADALYQDAIDRGLEGVIIKDLNSLYMVGKSYSSECINNRQIKNKWYAWGKRKPSDTYDLTVISIYEGTGKNVGRLGGVIVDYIGSDNKHYEVGVGSGFNDKDRILFWEKPNLIVGRTIKVVADVESEDSNGNKSLRFTRYKGLRSDK